MKNKDFKVLQSKYVTTTCAFDFKWSKFQGGLPDASSSRPRRDFHLTPVETVKVDSLGYVLEALVAERHQK